MKRIIIGFMVLISIFIFSTGVLSQNEFVETPDVKIVIDGRLRTYTDVPVIMNNRLLLPLRAISTSLGVPNNDKHIIWDGTERSVIINHNNIRLYLKIGNNEVKVNDELKTLDVAPVIYNDSTYVPVRFVSQSLNRKVVWDGTLRTVFITTQKMFDKVTEIIDKSNSAMKSIKRAKIYSDMNIRITQQDSDIALDLNMTTVFDRDSRELHLNMDMPIIGQGLSFDTYISENVLYERNFFTGEWESKKISDDTVSIIFEDNVDITSIVKSNTLCAGFVAEYIEETGQYVLEGNVYMSDLFNRVNQNTSDIFKYKLENYYTEVFVDKETHIVDKIIMDVKGNLDSTLGKNESEARITCEFTDINGDFQIVVPEEAVKQESIRKSDI